MNKRLIILLVVLLAVSAIYLWGRAGFTPNIFAGIFGSSTEEADQSSYEKSLSAWESLKAENGDTYYYTTSFQSWVGFGHEKTTQVTDGEVTSQKILEFHPDDDCLGPDCEDAETTVLTAEEIEGMPKERRPQTVDELYIECKEEVLSKDPSENSIVLKTRGNGILWVCQYRPRGCVDDCTMGVSIDKLEFGNAPEL